MYSTMEYAFLALVFVAVAGTLMGVSIVAFRPRSPIQRLTADVAPKTTGTTAPSGWQARVVQLVGPLARLAIPEEGLDYTAFRLHFMNAGFRSPSAPIVYFGAKLAAAMLLPLIFAAYTGISTAPRTVNTLLVTFLFLATLGFFLPNGVLWFLTKRRRRELFEAFPDAIDLLVVCVEAGLGLDAAIARTSEEMRLRSTALADELHLMALELRVGATREQALRNLALRTGLDDVSSLVTMLVQADRFGTNIADALRVHADSLRVRRQMRAEEAAAKLPVKMVFPLVLCVFPALMIVLAGPPFISIFRNLFPVISG